MSKAILVFAITISSIHVFAAKRAPASKICQSTQSIEAAAEKPFVRSAPHVDGTPQYISTTSTGKDKWLVHVSTENQCYVVVVYTEDGTCNVVNALKVGTYDCE